MAQPASRSRPLPRLLVPALVAAGAILVSPPVAGAEPAAEPAAGIVGDGWWNRIQGPVEAEPDNPLRPLLPAVPAPPGVPADAIAAGASGGEPEKVAAVAVEVGLPDGARVVSVTLRLTESAAAGANLGAEGARVVACPATGPWGPAKNAAWNDRPDVGCDSMSAEGKRADDGTWAFDLTQIARAWTDPFVPLAQYGVVLTVDGASAPGPVEVVWDDFASGGIAVDLVATPAPPAPPAPAAAPPDVIAPPTPAPAAQAPAPAVPVAPVEPVAPPPPPPNPFSPPVPVAESPPPTPAPPVTAPAALVAPVEERASAPLPRIGFWDNLGPPSILLLPVAVGSALLVGLALGSGGRPAPVLARAGGLTRAIARRGGPDQPSFQ